MQKVLSINRFTGIEARAAIGEADHPIANREQPPSIKELNELFMDWGVKMSTQACQQAIDDAQLGANDITHMVSTTCTNSANPGYDHFVAKNLGLSSSLEKVLLHGIGCSGGLAAMRTACNLALGAKARGRPARVLVCACEISSVLVRSELESIHQNQEVRIGVCLFSDCASACIVSNGIGEDEDRGSVFDVLGWQHKLLDDSATDLGFDVDPLGESFARVRDHY
jgi:type III polyketide synthase